MYLSTVRSPFSTYPLWPLFLAQFKQKDLQIFSAFPVFAVALLFHPVLTVTVLPCRENPLQVGVCALFNLPVSSQVGGGGTRAGLPNQK